MKAKIGSRILASMFFIGAGYGLWSIDTSDCRVGFFYIVGCEALFMVGMMILCEGETNWPKNTRKKHAPIVDAHQATLNMDFESIAGPGHGLKGEE